MQKYTIAVLVKNESGVLNRVTSMFRRRRFNINSLTVSETESDEYSRITVTYDGEPELNNQIVNQLYKLTDVCKVKELDSDDSVNCELMLIKVKNEPQTRDEIITAAEAYKAAVAAEAKVNQERAEAIAKRKAEAEEAARAAAEAAAAEAAAQAAEAEETPAE